MKQSCPVDIMKACGGLALGGATARLHAPAALPRGRAPNSHYLGGWVGPSDHFVPARNWTTISWTSMTYPFHYTNWALRYLFISCVQIPLLRYPSYCTPEHNCVAVEACVFSDIPRHMPCSGTLYWSIIYQTVRRHNRYTVDSRVPFMQSCDCINSRRVKGALQRDCCLYPLFGYTKCLVNCEHIC